MSDVKVEVVSEESINRKFDKKIAELWEKDRAELDRLRCDNARLQSRNQELEVIAASVHEDPTLKYLAEQLGTKGEHSLCETIDNVVWKLNDLKADNARLQSEVELHNAAWARLKRGAECAEGVPPFEAAFLDIVNGSGHGRKFLADLHSHRTALLACRDALEWFRDGRYRDYNGERTSKEMADRALTLANSVLSK